MNKAINSLLLTFLCISFCNSQVFWTFKNGRNGWSTSTSISGSTRNGIYTLVIKGDFPYLESTDYLNIDASTLAFCRLKVQNLTTDSIYTLFWITDADQNWNSAKSISFRVNVNDPVSTEYFINLYNQISWSDTIRRLRIMPGNGRSKGKIKLSSFGIEEFDLKSGSLTIKQDLTRGGAINYISTSTTNRNIVNIFDEGRYIQQSYYAGYKLDRTADGQSPNWSPWAWNPIQVGDVYRNRAQIIEARKEENSLYVKCIPMLWDMNNMPAEAIMEQWTYLNGTIIKVRNRLTSIRKDSIYGDGTINDQEIPAVYPISSLKNLYTYLGDSPFSNADVSTPTVINLEKAGFWGIYSNVTEKWMAFVDDSLWGIGVYSPTATKFLAGMYGTPDGEALSASTSYISPTRKEALLKQSVIEYEYYLIVDSLQQIRSKVYELHTLQTIGKGIEP